MSQIGSFTQIGLKIKSIWNHHPYNTHIDTATRFFLRAPPGRSPQFPPMVNVFGTKDKTLRYLNSCFVDETRTPGWK